MVFMATTSPERTARMRETSPKPPLPSTPSSVYRSPVYGANLLGVRTIGDDGTSGEGALAFMRGRSNAGDRCIARGMGRSGVCWSTACRRGRTSFLGVGASRPRSGT